ASTLARRMPWSNAEERQTLSTEIARHLRIVQRAGQTEAVCQPIAAYLTVRLDTISEQDVLAVARIYAEECSAAAARAELLADTLVKRYRDAAWTSVRAAS
ncbi:MAG TPA: hypothetical protein VEA16_21275, partial [Vicinamibacterales bacterium]|nr:hypothetical protein [Vicinamibacterales bacterium]